MTTEQEVIDLYRCLLGRDPESPDTVKAFRTYYPTMERGRKAVFGSDEFETFFAEVTGRLPHAQDHVAASLALALLRRAAAAAAPVPDAGLPDDALRRGMEAFFDGAGPARFAVAVGVPASARLDDLAPLGQPEAAVLQVAAGYPPALPWVSALEDGTTLLRLAADPQQMAAFLGDLGRRVDALYLLDRSAGMAWVDALRPLFAPKALVVVGPSADGFDAASLSRAVEAAHHSEPVVAWRGLHLHQVGGWLLPVTYAPPPHAPAAPDKSAYPKLGIAAIMRDEAVCVENMLRSVLPVASFVAILDTGSEDRTAGLARDVLSRSGVAHAVVDGDHVAFNDDFAAMRNAALDMVPDSVAWVLMLDGDEELVAEDYEKLLRLLAEAPAHVDAYALPRYNYMGADKSGFVTPYADRQIRLLRHTPDRRVRYEGRVHETVRATPHVRLPGDATAMGGDVGGPHIHHLVRRFRTPEQEERKQAFYREIAART